MIDTQTETPFSVYSSIREQKILNVPISNPLLICVLDGVKHLGRESEVVCTSGEFVFLSNSPSVNLRNIPCGSEYFALLIEFERSDFDCLPAYSVPNKPFLQGEISATLQQCLAQFVDSAHYIPQTLWSLRRQEILLLLHHLGYKNLRAIVDAPSLSHQVHRLISLDIGADISSQWLASELALSESTLRRRLRAEGSSVQEIKDRVKLGSALHFIQTSFDPIGVIAERCGYQSQSRFTDKFKQRFGITPTELRKTRMTNLGE